MVVDLTAQPRRGAGPLLRALTLGLGLGAAVLPGSAHAQFFGGWGGWDNGGGWDGLPGPEVRRSIAEQGFRVLGPLRRNGNVFVADVIDRRGRRERLIVAAADAQILQRFYVDDGRAPGAVARGGDEPLAGDEADRGGIVPPADIPGLGGRVAQPADRAAPRPRFGTLDEGDPGDGSPVVTPPLRGQPPIKTVRPPRPRVVERSPDTAAPQRDPAAVESTPLAPAAPRPKLAEPKVPEKTPATVASRPDAGAPAAPSTPAAPQRRLSDPLAIPGGPGNNAASGAPAAPPVRSVSGGVTGAPAPSAKPGDVPAAPLD